jgi:DNA replication protein DnaC
VSLSAIRSNMERLKLYYTVERISDLLDEATKKEESPLEFLDRVMAMEVEAKESSRIATSLKLSSLPRGMQLDNFDFAFQPSVEKAKIDYLATGEFIRKKECVLFLGPPGVGKSHLSVGLGVRAIELGYSVSYYTVEELLLALKKRPDVPVTKHTRNGYMRNALVVVDELGYQSLDRRDTHLFFQFISARYMKGSLILNSNRSVRDWVHIFAGDEMATTAILDRILHRVHLFNIDGRSYRLKDLESVIRGER